MLRLASAIFISYVAVYMSKNWQIQESYFFVKIIGFIITFGLSYYGFLIGTKIRDLLVPDLIWTDGRVSSIAKEKIFWAIGPQLITTLIAAAVATTIFFKVFGPSAATVQQRRVAEQAASEERWKQEHPQEAASIAFEKSERARQDAEDKARAEKEERRERILDRSSGLQVDFASVNIDCVAGKSRSAERKEWDAEKQKIIIVPATPNQMEDACIKADSILKKIRDLGTCTVKKDDDPFNANPEWIPCDELQ